MQAYHKIICWQYNNSVHYCHVCQWLFCDMPIYLHNLAIFYVISIEHPAANDIKIYSEVLEIDKANDCLQDLLKAKRIYFLGFGYHEQNLRALGMVYKVLNESVKIFGTAYNMSNREKETKRRRICESINLQERVSSEAILSNDWKGRNPKDSIIKDFFRNVPGADLV